MTALQEVRSRLIVRVIGKLTVDEHADLVAKVGHDVASPGMLRAPRPLRLGLDVVTTS